MSKSSLITPPTALQLSRQAIRSGLYNKMASSMRLKALRLAGVSARVTRRQFGSTPAQHAAQVKSLGVIGAGQMVSLRL